jgi:hypothetical protein
VNQPPHHWIDPRLPSLTAPAVSKPLTHTIDFPEGSKKVAVGREAHLQIIFFAA